MARSSSSLAQGELAFALCPKCYRTVPRASGERYCPNDGSPYVTACQACAKTITSPQARYCVRCGHLLTATAQEEAPW